MAIRVCNQSAVMHGCQGDRLQGDRLCIYTVVMSPLDGVCLPLSL